jgi:hypothetical protein
MSRPTRASHWDRGGGLRSTSAESNSPWSGPALDLTPALAPEGPQRRGQRSGGERRREQRGVSHHQGVLLARSLEEEGPRNQLSCSF